ncbi:MAG: AraC family transcriptional regulator [Bacilli bacterium]|nr:AraC family transcriptional regulator [Bacilli bacterium]
MLIKRQTQDASQGSFDAVRAARYGIAVSFLMIVMGLLAIIVTFNQGSGRFNSILLVVLLVGILIMAAMSGYMFQLIKYSWKAILQEQQSLQNQMAYQINSLREGFLLQLVQGYFKSLSESELRERVEQYGLQVSDRQFVTLIVQPTEFSSWEGSFSAGNQDVATFSLSNTIRELIDKRFSQANLIHFHDLSLGILIAFPNEYKKDQVKTTVSLWCEEFIEAVHSMLGIEITISISSSSSRMAQIPELFAKARSALNYRDVQIGNQIIDTDILISPDQYQGYRYPFNLEKEIIQNIRLGFVENTESRLQLFVQELSAGSAKQLVIQQGMLLLLSSIHHTLLATGRNPNQIFESFNLFEPFIQLREPEEMLNWFKSKVIQPLVCEMEKGKDQKLKQTVEKVVIHLQEQYMTDISLDLCADQMAISPFTLSKLFKQITGLNFIDYLTDIRIDKAKELLRGTELKINDVAEQIGYQPSYFARIFKRHEGVTPSQYRDMSRSKG